MSTRSIGCPTDLFHKNLVPTFLSGMAETNLLTKRIQLYLYPLWRGFPQFFSFCSRKSILGIKSP